MSVSLEKKKPRSDTSVLFFIQIFSTLGFAVLYSSLVLYATKKLGYSDDAANTMMGVFAAFNYGLHLFGGYLGGNYLSNRNLFVLGMLLQITGCGLIYVSGADSLYWGLALFLTGAGLNMSCINMMLTQRFTADDPRREGAFLWNYAGMNLGFFAGFTGAGYFQLQENYSAIFLFATLGNIVAILITLFYWKQLKDRATSLTQANTTQFIRRLIIGLGILAVLVPILRGMLTQADLSNGIVVVLGILVLIILGVITARHPHALERSKMIAYLLLTVGSLVFWSLYQLAPMGLILFSENNINLNIGGWHIAPQWIQNINTIVIVIGGPLLAWVFQRLRDKGLSFDIPSQFTWALIFMGLGMLVLPVGINFAGADGLVDFQWIFWSYLLQSIGELLISPIGYAMIGKLAPPKHQGLMMGSWMLVSGVASVAASYISRMMPATQGTNALATNPEYSKIFILLAIASFATAVILGLMVPLLRRLIVDKQSV